MGSEAKFLDSLLFDMRHDHFLKKIDFRPIDPIPQGQGVRGGGSAAKFCDSLLFDMQHDHVLKS